MFVKFIVNNIRFNLKCHIYSVEYNYVWFIRLRITPKRRPPTMKYLNCMHWIYVNAFRVECSIVSYTPYTPPHLLPHLLHMSHQSRSRSRLTCRPLPKSCKKDSLTRTQKTVTTLSPDKSEQTNHTKILFKITSLRFRPHFHTQSIHAAVMVLGKRYPWSTNHQTHTITDHKSCVQRSLVVFRSL